MKLLGMRRGFRATFRTLAVVLAVGLFLGWNDSYWLKVVLLRP